VEIEQMYETMDLYLQAAVAGQIDEVPHDMVLPLELHLMECVAVKTAGNEHLVHWQASEEYH
jgi:hypothetical protein